MQIEVGIHEAKTNLSKLLRAAEAGDEVVILRDHRPVAKLVPVAERAWGRYEGVFEVPADFDAPLEDDFLAGFEAGQVFPDESIS